MREEVRLWLEQARLDFTTAQRLLADGIFYASVFFSQQAGEKALKSLWVHIKQEMPPKTHNLVALCKELGAGADLVEKAAELTPEYILTRYPTPEVASPGDLYSENSARVHLEAALGILNWVSNEVAD